MALHCIDASFVAAWLIPDQRNQNVGEAWLAYLESNEDLISPSLMYFEAISALRHAELRHSITKDQTLEAIHHLISLPISQLSPSNLYAHAYEESKKYSFSNVYDACYVALAQILSCELLTLDKRLYNAVSRDFSKVKLIE